MQCTAINIKKIFISLTVFIVKNLYSYTTLVYQSNFFQKPLQHKEKSAIAF